MQNVSDLFTLLRFRTWNMRSITQRTVGTGHWSHCSRTVMIIDGVYSTVGTLWVMHHHPLQQPRGSSLSATHFTRSTFIFSPRVSYPFCSLAGHRNDSSELNWPWTGKSSAGIEIFRGLIEGIVLINICYRRWFRSGHCTTDFFVVRILLKNSILAGYM